MTATADERGAGSDADRPVPERRCNKPYSAAGAFQILTIVWKEVGQDRLGLSDFGPETQRLIAVWKLYWAGAIEALQRGNLADAVYRAASTWVSLPMRGDNCAVNQPCHCLSSVEAMYWGALDWVFRGAGELP